VIYPVILVPDDNGTFLVTCPDLPEVTTFGEDEQDALRHAVDAIEEALYARMAGREDIPAPSLAGGNWRVALPLLTSAKVELYRAIRDRGITKAALGRSLGCYGPQIDRLFDIRHISKIEQIDRAFQTIGNRLDIVIEEATTQTSTNRIYRRPL
jgi:antitoxin HicB